MLNGLYIVFCGMCMGACDLVPGISGGTIAFIMGFYSDLLTGIKSLKFKNLGNNPSVKFLMLLLSGILLSFVILAPIFDKILNHEVYRSYLYSGFLGLILASIVLCFKQIDKWRLEYALALILGIVLSFILTSLDLKLEIQSSEFDQYFNPWLIFCGAIAVCALLLPGISGSYLLAILGCYSVVIAALADFIEEAKSFTFDSVSFFILANLALGILFGALIFSRVVLFLLKQYHSLTTALMTGFMIGALPVIWPFWSYAYVVNALKPHKGLILNPVFPKMPELSLSLAISIALCSMGFFIVFLVESLAKQKTSADLKSV